MCVYLKPVTRLLAGIGSAVCGYIFRFIIQTPTIAWMRLPLFARNDNLRLIIMTKLRIILLCCADQSKNYLLNFKSKSFGVLGSSLENTGSSNNFKLNPAFIIQLIVLLNVLCQKVIGFPKYSLNISSYDPSVK